MKPDVCVLIPHYNNLRGLEISLSSISYIEPVDVLIVDDGSYIQPQQTILQKRFPHINNIILLNHSRNRGIEYVLNDGLRYIKESGYKYVARLDCGDVCLPERFYVQKRFLERNSDVYLVGSWVEFMDSHGKPLFVFKPPVASEKIQKMMFINNMFIHPSVMFRTELVESIGYYPTEYKNAEDYAYFFKITKKFKTENINRILLKCEVNPNGLSLRQRKQQIKSRLKVIMGNFDFSIYSFYGVVRNSFLYFVPYSLVKLLKQLR